MLDDKRDSGSSEVMRNPAFQQELPGLATALDANAMRDYLQAALCGSALPTSTIERCIVSKPVYLPGECCIVQYQLQLNDHTGGPLHTPLVIGRVYPTQLACADYIRDHLAPLAAQMEGRDEIAPFITPVNMIKPLHMAVHVFPIDGELPTLVGATDPQRMLAVFREVLPDARAGRVVIEACHIDVIVYRRRGRCVLRYTVEGTAVGSNEPRQYLVYGKLSADSAIAPTSTIPTRLREYIEQHGGYQFHIPRSLGWVPDLKIVLLEAIPGVPQIGSGIKARLRGQPAPPDAPPLEAMIVTGGTIAATLHTSGITLGPPRTLDDELAGLSEKIDLIRQTEAAFAAQAQSWLEQITTAAGRSSPLPMCLNHGDFKYAQLLFDGATTGLVDFDAACQAEPALDLGQFRAYLRTQIHKEQTQTTSAALGEELCTQFIRAYATTAGYRSEDEQQLNVRVDIYEAVSLLRMALNSMQKLKDQRLKNTMALLEARLGEATITRSA